MTIALVSVTYVSPIRMVFLICLCKKYRGYRQNITSVYVRVHVRVFLSIFIIIDPALAKFLSKAGLCKKCI